MAIDIRLDDFYEDRIKELSDHYREPTSVGMMRVLIRTASKEAGLWPAPTPAADEAPVTESV